MTPEALWHTFAELTVKSEGLAANNGKIITTSSFELHSPLLMVQRNVYEDPLVPLKILVGLEGVITVPPVPFIMLHSPVPDVGVLPASEVLVPPQMDWSGPELAGVGRA